MLACSRESLKNDRVAVVCSDQTIASYDTRTAKLTAQVGCKTCSKPGCTKHDQS